MLHSADWQLAIDVSGQPIGPILKGQAVQEETAVTNDQSTLHNIPEERRSHLHYGAAYNRPPWPAVSK
jgi:hypothetical protein